jgi:dihydrofolate reductase
MGISGQLPWNLPEDRKRFMDLTRDRLLIMGRKTYEERPDQSHIAHAYDSIVVSTSMQQHDDGHLRVARSLSEALHMAKVMANEVEILHNAEGLACWVVGGERIFNEALQHRSAEEVHLTLVDIDIDADAIASKSGSPSSEIAYFPAKYRWDRYYEEVSRSRHSSFTTVVYQRTKYSASMPR